MSEFQDKEVQCSDCPNKFKLSVAAQKFYEEKGLKQPKRCPPCRDKNREKHEKLGHKQFPKPERKPKPQPAPKPVAPVRDRELIVDMEPTSVGPNGECRWSIA